MVFRYFLFCKNQDPVVQDLDDPSPDVEEMLLLLPLVHKLDLPGGQHRDHGGMVGQHLKRAVDAGKLYKLYVIPCKNCIIRGDDFDFHRLLAFFDHLFALLDGLFDRANQVEGRFGVFIHLSVHDHIEPLYGIFNVDKGTGDTCELCGHMERL
jgi:hypothetical protein